MSIYKQSTYTNVIKDIAPIHVRERNVLRTSYLQHSRLSALNERALWTTAEWAREAHSTRLSTHASPSLMPSASLLINTRERPQMAV